MDGGTDAGDREVCATYARVSTRLQGQFGFSLGNQDQTQEGLAAAMGWDLPERNRFKDGEDEDASGADWDLPGLTRMLEAARRREFSVLIVPDFDRFARSLVKGLVLEEQLRSYGVRVVFQRVPVDDSPEGNLLKTQLYAFAEYDRQKIRLRTTMGKRAKAQSGRVVGGGRPPYGLRYAYETLANGKERVCALEPDPITGPIARDLLLGLRHRSVLETMADLNGRRLAGPRGTRWSEATLYYMAINPVYAGTWLYGQRDRRRHAPADPTAVRVPVRAPLLSRAEWDAVQVGLSARLTRRSGREPDGRDPYVLRGRLVCGRCRGLLWAVGNNGTRYYACACAKPSVAARLGKAPCDLPAVHAVALEAEVTRLLAATLLDPGNLAIGVEAARRQHEQVDAVRADRLAVLDAEIARHRRVIAGLVDELAELGAEGRAAIREKLAAVEDVIARCGAERAGLAAVRTEGLTADGAAAIMAFAAEVRAGLEHATPEDWRQVYDLIGLRGTVRTAPDGVRLGRRHRYAIDWEAVLPLGSSTQSVLTNRMLLRSGGPLPAAVSILPAALPAA